MKGRALWMGAFGAAMAAVGCGGGQAGAAGASSGTHTSKVGNAVITYSGQPKPQLTTSTATVSVLGQAGATFSTVTLQPPPNLADTYLTFTRLSGQTFGLYMMPWSTGVAQSLHQSPESVIGSSISAYGTVSFNNNVNFNAYTIRSDGTGLTPLTYSGITDVVHPSYAVDGTNRITFDDDHGHLYVGAGTGGTATLVQSNAATGIQTWSPAGNEIAYTVTSGGVTSVYETAPAGGTAVNISPSDFQGTDAYLQPLSWSPDGNTILATYTANGGTTYQLVKFEPASPFYDQILTPAGSSDGVGAFSPDGQKIAFYRSNAGGATPGIYVEDTFGSGATLLLADPSGATDSDGIQWSPFLPKETVIAASGSTFYHKAASGFLLSQNGSQFASLVAFTATTPSSTAIQSPASTSGTAPLIFTLTGDSITSVGYINTYFSTGTTLTLSSTPSVVVSIDGQTGQVDLVAPASEAKPSLVKNSDGTLTYKATFKSVYDGKGKNLAPSGASAVTVDPVSGKLVALK